MLSKLEDIRNIHKETKLVGSGSNNLLNAPDELLNYFLDVLRKEKSIVPPAVSLADWHKFIVLLSPHGISPYFYKCISILSKESLPPEEIVSAFKGIYLESVARSLRAEKQVATIKKIFSDNNIRLLILKGAGMSKTLYKEPGLRPSVDIDLLVRKNDFLKADGILKNLGYDKKTDNFNLFQDFSIEEIYGSKDKYRQKLELHWSMHHFPMISGEGMIEKLFERATDSLLCPVDNMIQSSTHMTMQHYDEMKLMWIMDIALLLEQLQTPEDWRDLKNVSIEWQVRPAVAHAIQLAKCWFGVKPPKEYENFIFNPNMSKLEKSLWKHSRLRYEKIFSMLYARGAFSFISLLRFTFPPIKTMKEKFGVKNTWQIPRCYIKRWTLLFKDCQD